MFDDGERGITFSDADLESLHSGEFPNRISRLIRIAVRRALYGGDVYFGVFCQSDFDDICQDVALKVYTLALTHDSLRDADRWFGVTIWRGARLAVRDWSNKRRLVYSSLSRGWGVPADDVAARDDVGDVDTHAQPLARLKQFILANIGVRELQVCAFALSWCETVPEAARFAGVSERTMYRRIDALRETVERPVGRGLTRIVCEALQACLSSDLQGA